MLLVLLMPGAAVAQTPGAVQVLESSVQTDFPASISFHVSARSNVSITDIRLHYQVEHMSIAEVTSEAYVEFVPGPQVTAQWDWDMRRTGGLPPGSRVTYWWTVTDAAGATRATNKQVFDFEDTRYEWRHLSQGMITLFWYRGDSAFAGELMSATQQALARIEDYAGARPQQQIRIYIYGSSNDLRGSMIFPQEWTGGVAFTRYSAIAIGIAPGDLTWGKRAIAHELTHQVIHQITFSPYGNLPVWLDEGLAMYGEGDLDDAFVSILYQAISGGNLLSLRSISSPFSAYADKSALAYAESYSIVKYLADNYGNDRIFTLLETYREGRSYDKALVEVYGMDMDALNKRWQDHLRSLVSSSPST